ncbi:hypothetical protein K438DRAFT_1757000 [Mycena galopus ATCC 62051]|nr:hypothetical protein K438DRAFT_1757000 [Mycena galopus ATCC 62051]
MTATCADLRYEVLLSQLFRRSSCENIEAQSSTGARLNVVKPSTKLDLGSLGLYRNLQVLAYFHSYKKRESIALHKIQLKIPAEDTMKKRLAERAVSLEAFRRRTSHDERREDQAGDACLQLLGHHGLSAVYEVTGGATKTASTVKIHPELPASDLN